MGGTFFLVSTLEVSYPLQHFANRLTVGISTAENRFWRSSELPYYVLVLKHNVVNLENEQAQYAMKAKVTTLARIFHDKWNEPPDSGSKH